MRDEHFSGNTYLFHTEVTIQVTEGLKYFPLGPHFARP